MEITLIALAIAFAVGATVVFLALLRAVPRRPSSALRVLAAVLIVIVFASLPGLFDATLSAMNRTSGLERLMIDPGWLIQSAPGIVGLLAAALLNRVLGRSRNAGT